MRHIKFAGLIVSIAVISGCTSVAVEPSWDAPKVVPYGWATDYDYTSSIWPYLRRQFDGALVEGASAYIYLYSDANLHCIHVRELVRSGQIDAAFRDVRITMLNFHRLRWLHESKTDIGFDPGNVAPVIIRVSPTGELMTKDMFYPDLYLFHTWMLSRLGSPERRPLSPPALAKKLLEFFQKNDEI